MDDKTHTYLLSDARKSLAEHRLLSALQSLRAVTVMFKASTEAEAVDSLQSSYVMLLRYFTQGADDPQRAKMYRQFVRRSYELSDVLERIGELNDSTSFYASNWRSLCTLLGDGFTLSSVLRPQANLRNIFDAVWLSGAFSTSDEVAVSSYLLADELPSEGKCLVVSALTLSAMRFFDIAKYRILLDAAMMPDVILRARALTGMFFIHIAHPERVELYPDVCARLQLMADRTDFKREVEFLQAQLFLSLETKRIERNLREQILPQVMKRVKNLHIDRSLGLDEIKDKLSEADLNPEWEADGKPSKLAEYMNEFIELQQRGADMYMSTFKMLKQRFPFFTVVANWFWPFSLHHPDVPEAARRSDTLKLLLHGAGLCDSDKFSFSLMVAGMPQASSVGANGMAINGLTEEMKQMLMRNDYQQPQTFKDALRSYVQGFYRFCNLFIHREAFPNPFTHNLFIVDYAPFNHLLDDGDFLVRMADFAFKDKTYALARNLYERVEINKRSAEICQKLGYCYEEEGQLGKAVDAYELGNALKPSSEWTLRRLATCRRKAGQYAEALLAYNELAALRTEDANVALRQAECLIYLERYDEAFNYLFKADYLAPESGQAVRAIAWCSLLTGKYEQAEHYYAKVLDEKASRSDYLNAGHAAWLLGHIDEAVNRYCKALPDEDKEHFLDEDANLLHKAGLTDDDFSIMTDAVLLSADMR